MGEPAPAATEPRRALSFSLRQIIAGTTAIGAGFALCYALLSPPLGSSGLQAAILPTVLLIAAIWFCRSKTASRLAIYVVVASLLAVFFFVANVASSDFLFGHFLGPPQLIIAACISSIIGFAIGIAWFGMKFVPSITSFATAQSARSPGRLVANWIGISAIIAITLVSAFVVGLTIPTLPRIQKDLDHYAEQRWQRGRYSMSTRAESLVRSSSPKRAAWTESLAYRLAQPGDEAAIPALLKLVRDKDPRVRRAASKALQNVMNQAANRGKPFTADPAIRSALSAALNDEDESARLQAALAIVSQNQISQDDRSTRMAAIAALGSAQDSEDVDAAVPKLLSVIEGPPDEAYRIEAIRSLSKMGPNVKVGRSGASRQAVYRLSSLIGTPIASPAVRSEAAKALAAMGPVAAESVSGFAQGWQQQWLTIEDAQALYQINPEAAARLQIPNADAIKPEQRKLLRHEYLSTTQPATSPPREGDTNGPEYLVGLIRTLNDEDPTARFNASTKLYDAFRFPIRFQNLPPAVVGDLVGAIKRPEPKVNSAALMILRFMGPQAVSAEAALVDMAKNSEGPTRGHAMYALAAIGPAATEAVPTLIQIVTDSKDSHDRSAAAKALGSMGKRAQPALPALREAWEKKLISDEDAQALYKIDSRSAEEFQIPRSVVTPPKNRGKP